LKYKDSNSWHEGKWPPNKGNRNQNNHLARPGSFSRGREKITRPRLVIVKMMMLLVGSLDFFASFFCYEKNEEPSRLEAKRRSVELKVSPRFNFLHIKEFQTSFYF
jgi:hypothetical protein